MQNGFEKTAAFDSGSREFRFQPVAYRGQFLKLGDDAALFGGGRNRNKQLLQDSLIYFGHGRLGTTSSPRKI